MSCSNSGCSVSVPRMWNPDGDQTIIHIDALLAEVVERYIVARVSWATSRRPCALLLEAQASGLVAIRFNSFAGLHAESAGLESAPAQPPSSPRRRSVQGAAKCARCWLQGDGRAEAACSAPTWRPEPI